MIADMRKQAVLRADCEKCPVRPYVVLRRYIYPKRDKIAHKRNTGVSGHVSKIQKSKRQKIEALSDFCKMKYQVKQRKREK